MTRIFFNDYFHRAGHSIANVKTAHINVSQISVKIPGTVLTPATPLHPTDGWPLDPLLCVRKLAAQMDQLMWQSSIRIISGQPATYQDVIEAQRRIYDVESLIPHRLQAGISADGKSLETVVKSDPVYILLAAFLHGRFCVPQIRLLRLFIFPKPGVPPEGRIKQLEKLLTVSKRHFLASAYYPHSLSMHPLVLYGLINTAIACALVLLINHSTPELVIEEDFFLSQLQKLIALFDMGKKTISATMARKAVTLLQTLIKQIELRSGSVGSKSWDRRKKGPGVAVKTNYNSQHADADDAVKKRKQQPNVSSKPHEPEQFESLSYGFGTLSGDASQAVRHNRHESEHAAKPNVGSSTSLGSISPGIIPIHTSPSAGIFPPALSSSEASFGQPTPPLVSSQPSRRPGFSTHSSSSQFSPTHKNACLNRSNSSPSFRAVASLPKHLDLGSNVEFGTIDAQLDNYQFHFPTLHSSAGYGKSGGSQEWTGTDEGTVKLRDEPNLLNIFDAEFLLHIPNWTAQTENNSSTQPPELLPINSSDLEYFQPTFNADFTRIADGVLSSTDLAGPVDPGRFSFRSHYEYDSGINNSK